MTGRIYHKLLETYSSNQKSLAVLVDPDVFDTETKLSLFIGSMAECPIDYFFIGGSLLKNPDIGFVIEFLKQRSKIPLIIFPGSGLHVNTTADAVLFLSLISGRNAELLIGQHVSVATSLKNSGIEIIPTGYILIDGGCATSVSYLSFTSPIPRDKPEIVTATAIAGELLGMKLIYLEAGSGATHPVPEKVIQQVRSSINVPLIAGGGINTLEKAIKALQAGADVIVIGNRTEQDPGFVKDVASILKKYNGSLNIH